MSSQSNHKAADPGGVRWATGVTMFAGVMLAISAGFQILQGISLIANDEVFVSGVDFTVTPSTSPRGAGSTSSSVSSHC